MADAKRKSRARIQQSALLPPNPEPNTLINRDEWIEQAAAGFITNSAANRGIEKHIQANLAITDANDAGIIFFAQNCMVEKLPDRVRGKDAGDVSIVFLIPDINLM